MTEKSMLVFSRLFSYAYASNNDKMIHCYQRVSYGRDCVIYYQCLHCGWDSLEGNL